MQYHILCVHSPLICLPLLFTFLSCEREKLQRWVEACQRVLAYGWEIVAHFCIHLCFGTMACILLCIVKPKGKLENGKQERATGHYVTVE